MYTYQALYQNEVRAVELTINDQDGQDFAPSAAYAEIVNSSGNTVVAEQAAQIIGNTVLTIVGTLVTANIGKYKIKWTLMKSGYTYRHATDLEVLTL